MEGRCGDDMVIVVEEEEVWDAAGCEWEGVGQSLKLLPVESATSENGAR